MKFMRSLQHFLAIAALAVSGLSLAEPPSPHSLVNAAQQAADAGDYRRAEDLIDKVPVSGLDVARYTQLQKLRGQILLSRNQPVEALKWLAANPEFVPQQASQILWLRGLAYLALSNAPAATRELVERERYLSQAQLTENRDRIWAGLFETPMDLDVLKQLDGYNAVTRGWVELAVLTRERGDIGDWRARYPGHPGTERIGSMTGPPLAKTPVAVAPPQRVFSFFGAKPTGDSIALLLPLTGAFSKTAEAVRDGFLSAYFKKSGVKPTVRVYDAGATASSTLAAYQQALDDGVGLVVGPLRKDGVAAIVQAGQPPVPMLALNYLDTSQPVFNLFQFGLAPEDEARAAAERAVSEGGRRAIVLVSNTDWGERAQLAFSKRLQELGGSVVAGSRYELGARDYSAQIKQLLNIEESEARHQALNNLLGKRTEFEPRRRDDADFIFIAARPAEGRMIWPQFRYHRSSGLPIYATSLIFGGASDPELNGLRFCDMPWMLQDKSAMTASRAEVSDVAAFKSQPRLFAMGYDAFMLASLIQKSELQQGAGYPAASGELIVDPAGVIGRRLACAQMDAGQPRLLESKPPKS